MPESLAGRLKPRWRQYLTPDGYAHLIRPDGWCQTCRAVSGHPPEYSAEDNAQFVIGLLRQKDRAYACGLAEAEAELGKELDATRRA
jgi:hypothetical protein